MENTLIKMANGKVLSCPEVYVRRADGKGWEIDATKCRPIGGRACDSFLSGDSDDPPPSDDDYARREARNQRLNELYAQRRGQAEWPRTDFDENTGTLGDLEAAAERTRRYGNCTDLAQFKRSRGLDGLSDCQAKTLLAHEQAYAKAHRTDRSRYAHIANAVPQSSEAK
jgi:hypothetical protein